MSKFTMTVTTLAGIAMMTAGGAQAALPADHDFTYSTVAAAGEQLTRVAGNS